MHLSILENTDLTYIYKEVLDKEGNLKVMPASYYKKLTRNELLLLAYKLAIYAFPTVELIEWLKHNFNLVNAIEIGSGNGILCRALGILGTDNFSQEHPIIKAHFKSILQPTIKYPKWIENIDAIHAIKKYKPSVVIGSWITQKYDEAIGHGSLYGPDEMMILNNVDTYIHIGNSKVHWHKKILSEKHREVKYDWLISRSNYFNDNIIYIWENER